MTLTSHETLLCHNAGFNHLILSLAIADKGAVSIDKYSKKVPSDWNVGLPT
jgi:hypothetical protein